MYREHYVLHFCTSNFHTNFEIVYPAMQFESVGAAES